MMNNLSFSIFREKAMVSEIDNQNVILLVDTAGMNICLTLEGICNSAYAHFLPCCGLLKL